MTTLSETYQDAIEGRIVVSQHTRRKPINLINAELERRAQRELTVQLLKEYAAERKIEKGFIIPFDSRVVIKDVTPDFVLGFAVVSFFVGCMATALFLVAL